MKQLLALTGAFTPIYLVPNSLSNLEVHLKSPTSEKSAYWDRVLCYWSNLMIPLKQASETLATNQETETKKQWKTHYCPQRDSCMVFTVIFLWANKQLRIGRAIHRAESEPVAAFPNQRPMLMRKLPEIITTQGVRLSSFTTGKHCNSQWKGHSFAPFEALLMPFYAPLGFNKAVTLAMWRDTWNMEWTI